MSVSIIVAMTPERVIGHQGEIPWHSKIDLMRFARITKGHPVIMGRKTCESIIKRLGHPLEERTNIVLTRSKSFSILDCIIASSFEDALIQAEKSPGSDKIFIIGGAEIYKLALPYTRIIYVTTVFARIDGDTHFPNIKEYDWLLEKDEEDVYLGHPSEHKTRFSVYINLNNTKPFPKNNPTEKKEFINLSHTRTEKQKEVMEQIEKDGVCPFCMEHLKKYHQNPIIKEGKWWIITKNDAPYEGSVLHLLFIYKPHAVRLSEINLKAQEELFQFITWAENYFVIGGGSLLIRFGDTNYTGGSVSHLHAHLIVGGKKKPDADSLKVKVGYKIK